VATDALSSQIIIQGINGYIIQYNVLSIFMIPHGISSVFTPANITSTTKYLTYSQPEASETAANSDDHNNHASGIKDKDENQRFFWE
jgi:hypothetical protein